MSVLHRFRDRADLTLDEVVDAAERLLGEIAPRQTRWAVSERPDVRTVRYYTTRGLLPKPVGYDGGRARYGYAHLVRLLAIKRMQAEHMTLEQIARVLAKTDDDGLALLVETAEAPPRVVPELVAPSAAPAPAPAPAARVDERSHAPASRSTATPIVEPTAPGSVEREHTLTLEPGGHLVLAADTLADPAKRARLADNLENLARMLRATNSNKKNDGNDNNGGQDA